LFEDKKVMNPANPEEVFSCSDLISGKWKMSTHNVFRLSDLQERKIDELNEEINEAELLGLS
jgi:hypothetical protein